MSAGTVVIAGGILAAVILLTIVAVLCLCRLQYYCCKREESAKGEEEEPELSTMSPSHPLALSAPPTPPTPERYGDEPETYPPTFLTEANGPVSFTPPPPLRRCQRAHGFCPACARCTLPFYLHHPERLCNGGRGLAGYRGVHQDPETPVADLAGFYRKLDLIRSMATREAVTRSVSTDV
ncbi:protein FAM163B [Hippocampus comes]|uniref:Family with sequence similarity 163 member B n=1 Tax=Hippocampus comes TaxID=109280 RepID=A0A3Q2Z0N8_HIPCM|nr:PREDICTED: protein FAM163B-like [Hippocampus comes]XP_019740220.1 PREDICTED: protein FAM163B-like [Hippocampus comes]